MDRFQVEIGESPDTTVRVKSDLILSISMTFEIELMNREDAFSS